MLIPAFASELEKVAISVGQALAPIKGGGPPAAAPAGSAAAPAGSAGAFGLPPLATSQEVLAGPKDWLRLNVLRGQRTQEQKQLASLFETLSKVK